MNRYSLLICCVLLVSVFNGCFSFKIEEDVNYPFRRFSEIRKSTDKLSEKSMKKGFSKVHFLIYDGRDRQLISFSVNRWLAKKALEEGLDIDEFDLDEYIGAVKLKDTDILDNLQPGLLMEVEDFENKNHILIWLQ